jgi:uncharacterized protein with PQ loop repeat
VTKALAACSFGFVLCPLPFLALAARDELQPTASALLTTAFTASAGFLLTRLLNNPSTTLPLRVFELASWATIIALLVFLSQLHLMRGIERSGTVSLVFLITSALSLPLTWARHTAIEQQIERLPRAVIITTLCAVLVLTGTLLVLYLTTPARFL